MTTTIDTEQEKEDMKERFHKCKDNLRFRHLKDMVSTGKVDDQGKTILRKEPIATVASVLDRDQGIMFAAMSRCMPQDTFNKEFGRHVARERLEKFEDYVVAQSSIGNDWDYTLFAFMNGDPVAVAMEDWFKLLDEVRPLLRLESDRKEFLNKVRKQVTVDKD